MLEQSLRHGVKELMDNTTYLFLELKAHKLGPIK